MEINVLIMCKYYCMCLKRFKVNMQKHERKTIPKSRHDVINILVYRITDVFIFIPTYKYYTKK